MKEVFTYCSAEPNEIFEIKLAGISYCDGSYHIFRTKEEANISVFEYIISGTGTVMQNDSTMNASAGDVYIMRQGLPQQYCSSADKPWVKLWFNISGKLCEDLIELYGLDGIVYSNTGSEDLFRRFLEITESGKTTREINMLCAGIFHQIVSTVAKSVASGCEDDAELLKNYLDRSYKRVVSIEELSRLIYKSKSQTIRIFKQKFGQTPYEYLLNRRITTAKALLRSTGMPMKQIASELGFADEHYFSNVFFKEVRVRPKVYRGNLLR